MSSEKDIFEQSTEELIAQKKSYHLREIQRHQQEVSDIDVRYGKKEERIPRLKPVNTASEDPIRWSKLAEDYWNGQDAFFQIRTLVKNAFPDKDEDTIDLFCTRCSVSIARMIAKSNCTGYKVGGVAGFYYGRPEWFSEGKPKEKYLNKIKSNG